MNTSARFPGPAAWLLVATVTCAGGAACAHERPTGASDAASTPPIAPLVDVVQVVQQPLDIRLSLPSELTPFQSVDIYPRVAGFVRTVTVDRGSSVRTGELLLTLDAPELVARRGEAESKVQAAQAQAAAVQARADADQSAFERLKAASATPGVVAGIDVTLAEKTADASRHQLAAAQQAVETARQALAAVRDMENYLRVTAPFAGVITERNVHPGALAGPGDGPQAAPALRLVDTRRLRLVIPVPEAYTTHISPGTEVGFTVAAYPGRTFFGIVSRLSHAVDVASRTMAVELDVTNGGGELAPGTFCQVQWPVRRPTPSLFVPSEAVATTTDRTFVIRVRHGRTEWVNVRTGLTSGEFVEVFGELQAGDQVAGRASDELRAGIAVQVTAARPPAQGTRRTTFGNTR